MLRFTLLLAISLAPIMALAQLSVHYLPYHSSFNNFRTASHDSITISLPFWDDFSTSHIFPDTGRWLHSNDVIIQSGAGVNPPSVNVAVFDGADQFGNPYSTTSIAIGEGDVLTSRFIDLSEADQGSTHLSFYYQREGLGELPDQEDSLSLFLKGADSVWVKAFNASGADDLSSSEFYYVNIPIDDPKFFFEYFQFSFTSYGRISGPYDNWNVDYIYLDEGRSGERSDLVDHAAVTYPTSLFGKYTSVPYDQFMSDPGLYLEDSIWIDLVNLEDQVTNIETKVELRFQDDIFFALINPDKNLPDNIAPYAIIPSYSDQIDPTIFSGVQDSLYLKSVFSLNTLDSVSPINLRVNDTVATYFSIHQELAYDDGSAEYGAGLNDRRSQLAYRFYTPIEDQITGMKIYFPRFGGSQSSRAVILKIWSHLDDDNSGVRYTQETVAQVSSSFNEFTYYQFFRPVTVSDTFYIGFEQTHNDFFPVGLDKNTNTGEDIFYNPDVRWQQNTTVQGSLMMRPVFGNVEDFITGIDPEYPDDFRIYPNPSLGMFTYEGKKNSFVIYDIFGRRINMGNLQNGDRLDLSGNNSGVYILKLGAGSREKSVKLIIK